MNMLERLSELEHMQWMEWSKAVANEVSPERRSRWEKYWVPYNQLTEEVKEQDRVWARKVIDTFQKVEKYIKIKFQEGPIKENGVNGCQIEDVIDVLVERLQGFQAGEFHCRENALAITKLEEARLWLDERTRKRLKQGVEGKNEKHQS